MTERTRVIATMAAHLYAAIPDTDRDKHSQGNALVEATNLLNAAERADADLDPGRLCMSLHGTHRALICTAEAKPPLPGGLTSYDVIKIGWDLTLFLDRRNTEHLHAVLSALIAPPPAAEPPAE